MFSRSDRIGLAFVLISVLGYSFLPVFTRHLLNDGVTPIDIAVWRFILATPLFWLLTSLHRTAGFAPRLPSWRLMAMGLFLAGAALTAFFGLQRLPAGTYVVIFYTYPAMVAIISLFLGERLSGWGWFALALTLFGVALTAPDFSEGLSGDNLPGVLLALLNAALVAFYFVFSSRLLRGQTNLIRASAYAGTGALLALLVVGFAVGIALPPTPGAWVNLLLLASVSTVMPIFALFNGLQRLGAARAAVFGTIEPLLTSVLALIFLGEMMAAVQWLGGIVIVASVIILQTRGIPSPARAATPSTAPAALRES